MKSKISTTKGILLIFSSLIMASCTFDTVIDLDGPSVDGVLKNASKGQLNELVVGTESNLRNGLGLVPMATMSRDLYVFNAEPRTINEPLGKNGNALSPITGTWNGRYRAIKNANILMTAVSSTEAVSEEEANGYYGFANTIIAYELMSLIKVYNKARVDVNDPENLGPILEFKEVLTYIRNLLDDAQLSLNAAGSDFAFNLSDGFNGFDTPASFSKFNRAIAAVAAVYDNDGPSALTALSNSFFDLGGNLKIGPKHIYGLGGGDQRNPSFRVPSTVDVPNNGDQVIVHNSFINNAEAGDLRVTQKTGLRPNPTSLDGLNGTHEGRLYESSSSSIDIIRNEELILVYAEANIISENLQKAEEALNVIRNSAGLPDYSGLKTKDALTTEMLKQRRYSLWFEGHRMFDLRRYGLSSTLPIDRPGDQIFNVWPIPQEESDQ